MAVLPKQSSHAVPECYRYLLSDPSSPVIDFYPVNFKLDVNGAAFAWMGVNLLPYIEMDRLLAAMAAADNNGEKLNSSETERNKRIGDTYIYFEKKAGSESALRANGLSGSEPVMASFERKDPVYGRVE